MEKGLSEKLDLFGFSPREREGAITKFSVTLGINSYDELKAKLDYLAAKGIRIEKAKDLKVFANSYQDLEKNVSILEDIKEVDIYRNEPSTLNCVAMDLYRRIQHHKQAGLKYKNELGEYEGFIKKESEWKKEVTSEKIENKPVIEDTIQEASIVTVEPVVEEEKVEDLTHKDINEYMETDMKELDKKITDFEEIRSSLNDLKRELSNLEDINNAQDLVPFSDNDFVSFNDLNAESYEMRRAA